jgi:oligoendopeptidase F
MPTTETNARRPKAASIKTRHGVSPERWDLSHILSDPVREWDTLSKKLDGLVTQFESWRARLSPAMPAESFLDLLRLSEQIGVESSRLSAYAYLWFSENTKALDARTFKTKVEELLTAYQNRMLFFDLWWQQVDAPNAARLTQAAGDYGYHLDTIRRFTPYTLSEPEEKVINIKTITGRTAMTQLYDIVTNGLTFTLRLNGRPKRLTREQLSAYVRHPRPRVREAAYQELHRVFAQHHDLIGEIYATLIKDWKGENLELRQYASPIAARNVGNDIPDQAVTTLLTVCEKNTEVFQHYFRLKARLCRIKPMNRYHLYAPHFAERKRYRYADALRMVLEAYRGFSPRLAELARQVIEEHHLDARLVPGKLSGAYCYSIVPGLTPYILLNYTGEARDVATLAHELGHAVHGLMAADHSVFTFHSALPLAETASVFGERLLSDALMAQESNRSVKQGLLIAQLDDLYATIQRQAYFVLFEQAAHVMVGKGATVKDLAAAYRANLGEQFGNVVAVPASFQWEWLTIPHIFTNPFYCYAYSFGNLLVLALYHLYKQQGGAFVPRYLSLLAAGGSQSPEAILAPLGIDIRAESFWQSGFHTIRTMVEELEGTMP